MSPSRTFYAWLRVVLYAAFIFYLSSKSHPIPFFEAFEKNHLDWILHGVEYGILGFLLVVALASTFRTPTLLLPLVVSLWLGTVYAFSDEWHQSFVPGRDSSIYDVNADVVGLLVGSCLKANRLRKS